MYGVFGREITKYTVIYGVCIYGSGQPYTYACSHKPTLTHTMLNILGLHPGSSKSNSKGDVNMQNAYTRETCEMRTHAKCVHTQNAYTREMRTHAKCVHTRNAYTREMRTHTHSLAHPHVHTYAHAHMCRGIAGCCEWGSGRICSKG